MWRSSTRIVPAALLAWLACAPAASAQQVMFDLTFENPANNPAFGYSYDFAGGGDPATNHDAASTSSWSFTAGGGRDGGNAFRVSGNFSAVPTMTQYNYKGIGGGFGVFRYNFGTNTPLGVPSGDLADFTYTADLAGAGYEQSQSAFLEAQLFVPDDRFTTDANPDMDLFAIVRFPIPGGLGINYETYTFRGDQGTLTYDARVPAGEQNFAAHAHEISLINTQVQLEATFGPDNDNLLLADNLRLTVVPEPASGVLLAAGLALAVTRRPRRDPRL